MQTPDLNDAVVELTSPDGKVYRFRYGATIPYAGQDYVVLLEMESDPNGEEQILVTRLEEENGELSFVVAEEEDVVEQVFTKYCALSVQTAVADLPENECGCGHNHHDDEDCGCGHHHHDDEGCGCGHHHHDDEGCGCGHHHHDNESGDCGHHHHDDEGCGCGHHHHDGGCGCHK